MSLQDEILAEFEKLKVKLPTMTEHEKKQLLVVLRLFAKTPKSPDDDLVKIFSLGWYLNLHLE